MGPTRGSSCFCGADSLRDRQGCPADNQPPLGSLRSRFAIIRGGLARCWGPLAESSARPAEPPPLSSSPAQQGQSRCSLAPLSLPDPLPQGGPPAVASTRNAPRGSIGSCRWNRNQGWLLLWPLLSGAELSGPRGAARPSLRPRRHGGPLTLLLPLCLPRWDVGPAGAGGTAAGHAEASGGWL